MPSQPVQHIRLKNYISSLFRVPLSSLSDRNFRFLWLGQVGQAFSMWAEHVARNWLVWEMTESGLALGLVNLFRTVPLLLVGLYAGVAADRYDKRKLLILMQVFSLLIYVLMSVLIVSHRIELWHVYVAVALLGLGAAMNQSVRTAWVPHLVGQPQLLNALSLNSIAINATRLVVPVFIGILIGIFGVGIGYITSSVAYALIIVSTYLIHPAQAHTPITKVSAVDQLLEGLRFLSQDKLIFSLILVRLGPLAFAFSYMTLLPIMASDVLGMGSGGFGALMSAGAIGALIGGLTLAFRSNVLRKGRLLLIAGLSYGIVLIVLGGVPWSFLVFLIIPLAGACQTVFRTSNNAVLLEATPSRLQGRIISMTLFDAAMAPLASILVGFIADSVSVSIAIIFAGALCFTVVGGIALLEPKIRRM